MRLNDKDISFLFDMYTYACEVDIFVQNISFYDYEKNKYSRWVVERLLITVGEAAKKISKETQSLFPSIPWKTIIGARNIIAHDYGDIINEKLYLISKNSIPELIKELDKIDELKYYIKIE